MNIQDTLYALYEETEKTTIFALISYEDAKTGIGFRRECCGSDLKDPIIDGTSFMLCADAWNKVLCCPIGTMFDLACTPTEDIEIRLQAISMTFPFATVQLGRYDITGIMIEAEEEMHCGSFFGRHSVPTRCRLAIERVS